jgi:long-chain acyl-CoA synthetase
MPIDIDRSLPALLRAAAARHGAARASVFEGRATTLAEFDRLSDRAAAALAARGVRPGDRVGLLAPNSDRFAVAYFGIVKAGAVVVPVNLLLNPKEMAWILKDAGAKGLIHHAAFGAAAAHVAAEGVAAGFRAVIGGGAPGAEPWESWLAGDAPAPEDRIRPAEDLAAILYTSGTTGYPKGAMLTHRNLAVNVDSVARALELRPAGDVFLAVLPMFHAFSATVCMLSPLLTGCCFVPLAKFEPERVARAIGDEGVTILAAVPSMLAVLLRAPEEWRPRFATLRRCFSGGAALPVEILRQFEARFGIPVCEGDGPTECSPVTCVNPVRGPRKPGTVGLPVAHVEMKICDEDGRERSRGEIGEICVRGPNVMKGYWNRPEDTRAAFFGEWFRTGDLGTEDEDGYFSIVDRKKDMLITNGMNVYPRIVEEVLYRHPAVREAAVVGEPHETHGEIPVAFVALHEGAAARADELRAFCRENLGRHEVPRKVFFLKDLPKSGTGKILKRELRKQGEWERGVDSRSDAAGGAAAATAPERG